jgi:protoporphyrinogen/coproporphyrinogen III oxidase
MIGRPQVVVVGAGIAGLAVAHRLATAPAGDGVEVLVLDAADRVGGVIRSVEVGGLEVEAGPDSFVVRKPWAVDLCMELRLGDDLVVPATRSAFLFTGGRLVRYPRGSAFGIPSTARELMVWPGLSLRGRVRALADLIRPSASGAEDETIGALARRRLGAEAAGVLVGPLLAGIHAGDPERLSVRATFPELAGWEQQHESLIRGARAALRVGQGEAPMFATVWGGLSRLVEALVDAIGPERVRTSVRVRSVHRDGTRFAVETDEDRVPADAVVVAAPALAAAGILQRCSPELASDLAEIPYSDTATVALVYPEGTASRLPDGMGVVVPPGNAIVTACTWLSRKWPREEFGERAVVRVFVGRAGAGGPLRWSDDDLSAAVAADVERTTPIGPPPDATRVVRWERTMPQYEVGHLARLSRIQTILSGVPGLFLTGSAYRGVGIADCVRHAQELAGQVRSHLAGRTAASVHPTMDRRGEDLTWTR